MDNDIETLSQPRIGQFDTPAPKPLKKQSVLVTDTRHTLESEINFINKLGQHTNIVGRVRMNTTRRQLLQGYAIGLEKRVRGFSADDLVKIRQRLTVLLAQE